MRILTRLDESGAIARQIHDQEKGFDGVVDIPDELPPDHEDDELDPMKHLAHISKHSADDFDKQEPNELLNIVSEMELDDRTD